MLLEHTTYEGARQDLAVSRSFLFWGGEGIVRFNPERYGSAIGPRIGQKTAATNTNVARYQRRALKDSNTGTLLRGVSCASSSS